jgi:hypothetical protein
MAEMKSEPNPFDPRDKWMAGRTYVADDPQARLGPHTWQVITHGDGTLKQDSIAHGLFWNKNDALTFWEALQTKRGVLTPEEWLRKVHLESESEKVTRLHAVREFPKS